MRKARFSCRALLEALEPRQLMAVDLQATFVSVPSAPVASGTRQSVTLNVQNAGDTSLSKAVAFNFYAVQNGTAFDPTTATPLLRSTPTVSIAAGGTRNFTFQLPLSAGLTPGSYQIVAVVDPQNKIAETDESNNTVASSTVTITQPQYDLETSIGVINTIPTGIVAGSSRSATLQVVLTNPSTSTATIPAGSVTGIQVVARPVGAVDASQDIVLTRTTFNSSLGSMPPGRSRAFNVPLTIPASLAMGSYDIIATADVNNLLAETSETNNTAVVGFPVTVSTADVDFALTFDPTLTLPVRAVSNGTSTIPLVLNIANVGNVTSASRQTGVVTIFAHNVDTNVDTVLQTLTVPLNSLTSGRVRSLAVRPALPAGLATGDYTLTATLSTNVLTDDTLDNVTSTDDLGLLPIAVDLPAMDVLAGTAGSSLPISLVQGQGGGGVVNVNITNNGNLAFPVNQRASVTVTLRPVGASTSATDIVIGSVPVVNIGSTPAGTTLTVAVPVAVPFSLPLGDYVQILTVTPTPALVENNTFNNSIVGNPVFVSTLFNDIGIVGAGVATIPGSTSVLPNSGTVQIANFGNLSAVGNVTVTFYVSTTGDIAGAQVVGGQTIALSLIPGETHDFTIPISLPANAAFTPYVLIAQVVPTMADDFLSNNVLIAGQIS